MITGLQDVYFTVADMERALAFYGGVLGLRVDQQHRWWSSLDVGGVRLGLHWSGGDPVPEVPGDAHGPEAGGAVTLRVDDIRATVAELKRRGVRFLGEVAERPFGAFAVFRDPDGNYLTLMQPRQRAET